jgi:hypothetical protein
MSTRLATLGVLPAAAWGRIRREEPLYTRASLHAVRNHRLVSDEKARRELGHAPRPLATTIADAISWFRDAKMLR